MDRLLPPGFTLLQVVPRLESGGVERATLDLSREVVRAGGRSLVASQGGRLGYELATQGGELIRLPVHAKAPATVLANAARLAKTIQTQEVGLVQVRSRAPAFSALLAARWTGVPVVTTYHGIYGGGGALKRWYNGVMARGDLVVANSAFTRDHLLDEHGPDPARVIVIPEGIDTGRFDRAAVSPDRIVHMRAQLGPMPEGAPILLLAARLTSWKGQALAIEALPRLKASPVLALVGATESPAYEAELRARAIRLGVADRVRFAGPIEDVPAALAVADLVLAPSLKAESFGRGVVEAMAMGRPVIASGLGAHRETIVDGETGWLVPRNEPRAWADALGRALATPPEQRAAMGEKARRRAAAAYDLGAMAGATFAAYRRLLEHR